jgi:hypothetical protein
MGDPPSMRVERGMMRVERGMMRVERGMRGEGDNCCPAKPDFFLTGSNLIPEKIAHLNLNMKT